jgi:hypothetical protein
VLELFFCNWGNIATVIFILRGKQLWIEIAWRIINRILIRLSTINLHLGIVQVALIRFLYLVKDICLSLKESSLSSNIIFEVDF